MAAPKEIDIDQLIPDDKNANKGTKKGSELIEKSFQELGAGRSVLLDKNNRLIAGNKSTDAAKKAGIKKVRIIETDGTELIAVKRTDIDLDSKQGRELAIADNSSALAGIKFDYAIIDELSDLVEMEEWGIDRIVGKLSKQETIDLKPYKKTHILLSFHPEKLIEIQQHIEKIITTGYVEIEQSSN